MRRASISIYPDLRVVVSAPSYLPEERLQAFILSKEEWIQEKLRNYRVLAAENPPRQWVSGESISIFDQVYVLKVIRSSTRFVEVQGNELVVAVPDRKGERPGAEVIRRILGGWIQAQALEHFKRRTEYFSALLRVNPKTVSVRNYRGRWGACKSTRDIVFNWRLALAPLSIVDYVVVHELCHLMEFNHSPHFWALVGTVMPNYKEMKKELKRLGYLGVLEF